jgi:hypothetical protein
MYVIHAISRAQIRKRRGKENSLGWIAILNALKLSSRR